MLGNCIPGVLLYASRYVGDVYQDTLKVQVAGMAAAGASRIR